jgi:Family of unknown function (DUF6150)
MRTLHKLILTGYYLFAFVSYGTSQSISITKYRNLADVILFETNIKSQADITIFKTKYKAQGNPECGIWYESKHESQTNWTVYFAKYPAQADCKVYFTKYRSEAARNICYFSNQIDGR